MFIIAENLKHKFIIYETYQWNIYDFKKLTENGFNINDIMIFKARENSNTSLEISRLLKKFKLSFIQNYSGSLSALEAEEITYFDELQYAANIIQKYWRMKILFRWLPKKSNKNIVIR